MPRNKCKIVRKKDTVQLEWSGVVLAIEEMMWF